MDRTVLSDPAVAGYVQEHFVPFLLDVHGEEGTEFLKRRSLKAVSPVVLFYEKGGREIDRIEGLPDAKRFLAFLKAIAGGNHFAALEKRAATDAAFLDDYDNLVLFGGRLHDRRDPRARGILLRATRMDPEGRRPDAPEVRFLLADSAPDGERWTALAEFVRANPESRHAVKVHRWLVTVFAGSGKEVASYEYLHEHSALRAPWEHAAFARLLAFSGKRIDLALELITGALRIDPENARYHDTRAECLSRLGRQDDAIEEETIALAKATRLEEQAEFRRALYEMRKRRDEAR